jgi:probable HAF family extracellular repeat protein
MHLRIGLLFATTLLPLLAGGAGPVAAAPPAAVPGYTIVDLGALPGGCCSEAHAINDRGQVVGQSATAAGPPGAFLWQAGAGMQALAGVSFASGINNLGQVVGQGPGCCAAVLWQPGTGVQALGTLPGATYQTYAKGINDQGQVVGTSYTDQGQAHAFLWEAGPGMRDLGTLPGGTTSIAFAINDRGQVAGTATTAGGLDHAFL